MKKILAILLSISLCMSLSACSFSDIGSAVSLETEDTYQDETDKACLVMAQDTYNLTEGMVQYTIQNNTKDTLEVTLIPTLEKKTRNGWEIVESDAGFCGTPDLLEEKLDGILFLDWFPGLSLDTTAYPLP